jgi:hypothetical protein
MNPHPNFCTKVYVSPRGVNHEPTMKHESSRQKLAPVHVGLTSHPRFTSHPRSRVKRGMRDEGLRLTLDPEKNVNWPTLGDMKGGESGVIRDPQIQDFFNSSFLESFLVNPDL